MAMQAEMWRLQYHVEILQHETGDSLLQAARDSAERHMLHGWKGFAQWSEQVRAKALQSEFDMDWKVGDTLPIQGYDRTVSRVPVSIKVLPFGHGFEATLKFVVGIVNDSTLAWKLSEVYFEGKGEELSDTRFTFEGWLLE